MGDNVDVVIDSLLTHTKSLLNHIYWVKQDFSLNPNKEHIATAINYTDISERRIDFVNELVNTIVSWVYNKHKIKHIIDDRLKECNGDYGNANAFLTSKAFSKFRPGYPQGQFGELLLFNFIQYFFGAVPILRKQRITTSFSHERYGADAIHYKKVDDINHIILGESKCYESKYKFKDAFKKSIKSIESSFNNLGDELDIYIYEDFIEDELEQVAIKYKKGTLKNVFFELVCLVAYNETNKINGECESTIKSSIVKTIEKRCYSLDDKIYDSISSNVLKRINYIVFPIWELDKLLDIFQNKTGSQSCP